MSLGERYTAPHFDASALLTIYTQCDVLDGAPLEIPGTSAALPRMRELTRAFRAAGRPIVHIVRIYEPDGSNVDACRRELVEQGAPILATGAPGTELAPELLADGAPGLDASVLLAGGVQAIGENESIVYKPRWGAFFQTPLERHLRERGIDTLVFAGCNFPNCPRTSIYEASERDFRVVLARDALSGVYERGVGELRAIGVTVSDTAWVLDELSALGSTRAATSA